MPGIRLSIKYNRYITDQNVHLRAWRAYADVRFETVGGNQAPFPCIVDSGAPFSVIPFSLWSGRNLNYDNRGDVLYPLGSSQSAPEPLEWRGIRCFVGRTYVHLVDANQSTIAGPFILEGKFATISHPDANIEKIAVLGLNFLEDNSRHLHLFGRNRNLTGNI